MTKLESQFSLKYDAPWLLHMSSTILFLTGAFNFASTIQYRKIRSANSSSHSRLHVLQRFKPVAFSEVPGSPPRLLHPSPPPSMSRLLHQRLEQYPDSTLSDGHCATKSVNQIFEIGNSGLDVAQSRLAVRGSILRTV